MDCHSPFCAVLLCPDTKVYQAQEVSRLLSHLLRPVHQSDASALGRAVRASADSVSLTEPGLEAHALGHSPF